MVITNLRWTLRKHQYDSHRKGIVEAGLGQACSLFRHHFLRGNGPRFYHLKLLNFSFNVDPDPAFHYNADPDPVSKNNADLCGWIQIRNPGLISAHTGPDNDNTGPLLTPSPWSVPHSLFLTANPTINNTNDCLRFLRVLRVFKVTFVFPTV